MSLVSWYLFGNVSFNVRFVRFVFGGGMVCILYCRMYFVLG